MTRKEFLKKEVEEVVNNKILPILSKREKDEKLIEKINMMAFLYSVGRINPLRLLMCFARELTDEEFEQINQQMITEEK